MKWPCFATTHTGKPVILSPVVNHAPADMIINGLLGLGMTVHPSQSLLSPQHTAYPLPTCVAQLCSKPADTTLQTPPLIPGMFATAKDTWAAKITSTNISCDFC